MYVLDKGRVLSRMDLLIEFNRTVVKCPFCNGKSSSCKYCTQDKPQSTTIQFSSVNLLLDWRPKGVKGLDPLLYSTLEQFSCCGRPIKLVKTITLLVNGHAVQRQVLVIGQCYQFLVYCCSGCLLLPFCICCLLHPEDISIVVGATERGRAQLSGTRRRQTQDNRIN